MPTKYKDRLNLPVEGMKNITFFTSIGLGIAIGYERIVFKGKIPYIEFSETQINKENIFIPNSQKWKINNKKVSHVEYRSKDCCNVKIIFWKDKNELVSGRFYISPFDLKSDQISVLIEPLYRKRTLQII